MPEQPNPSRLSGMSTGYFGLVMATGIVSIGLFLTDFPRAAFALFLFNCAAYVLLLLLYLLRLFRYPRAFLGDFALHARAPGYFTIVAGSGILAVQFLRLVDAPAVAAALGAFALLAWAILTYSIFPILTVRREKPDLEKGLNGTWLLAVVATQSLSVLASQLAAESDVALRLPLDFFALVFWLAGGMLYIWTIAIIFYRYLFFPIRPDELTPPYWINMGAMAISTLAGTFLISRTAADPFLFSLTPFLAGITVLFWATASWWIPILLMLGVWRYIGRRFPFHYNPQYWSVVFPLGMYAVATFRMVEVLGLPFLIPLARVFLVAAVFAWAATFLGMARDVGSILVRRR